MPTSKTNIGFFDGRYMKSGRSATIVVAASDSRDKCKWQADYVCDGTADDVQIQAAIDALSASGGRVQLLEGTYYVNIADHTLDSAIYIDSDNICLCGAGWNTIISVVDDTLSGNIIVINGADGIAIHDLKIHGNADSGKAAGGIYVNDSDGLLIENCSIYAAETFAVAFRDVSHGKFIGNRVEIVTEPAVANRCIDLDYTSAGNADIVIAFNTFLRTGYTGTKTNATKIEHAEGVRFHGNYANCLVVVDNSGETVLETSDILITENTVTKDGIYINGRTGIVKIVNNDITDGQIMLTGNPTDTGANALAAPVIVTGNHVKSAKNYLTGAGDTAIEVNQTGGALTISDNMIVTPGTSGVTINYAGNTPAWHSASIRGNQIYQPPQAGISLETTDNIIIEGNIIDGPGTIAISLSASSGNVISQNRIYSSGLVSIDLDNSDNNIVLANLIKDSASYGIAVDDSDYNAINSNRIINPGANRAAIEQDTSDYNIFQDNLLSTVTFIKMLGAHSWTNSLDNYQTISAAGTTISAGHELVTLAPDNNYTLTSTPTIADGIAGQHITLMVVSGFTLTFQDEDTLAGSNLQLAAATRQIAWRDVLELIFDGTYWCEVIYTNN